MRDMSGNYYHKVVKIMFRYPFENFRFLDFGFWIGSVASLYPYLKQAEYLKSAIRNPQSKI